MAEQGDWVSSLRGIIERMVAAHVSELELQQGELRIRLRRDPSAMAPQQEGSAAEPPDRDHESFHKVAAPLTGIFYAAPNPSSKPYLAVGDWVENDTLVGLIETMKVFNEVAAECRGRVAALLAEQGQLVHANEPLLLVDTGASPDRSGEVAP